MARVNVTIPEELVDQARAAGINISRVSAGALSEELDRRAKLAALERYLDELDAELGPVSDEEESEARDWADRSFGATPGRAPEAA